MNTRLLEERRATGQIFLHDQLEVVDRATKQLLASLEGFRRDLSVAKNSDSPVKISIERITRSFVPPALSTETQLTNLREILVRATGAFEGKITIPSVIESPTDRMAARTELHVIHENLGSVARSAQQLHDILLDSSRIFYAFNGENGEDYREANIVFDEASMNASISTARALIEHAVRMDIEVVSLLEKIDFLEYVQETR